MLICYYVQLLTNLFLRSRGERDEIRRQTNNLPWFISLPSGEKCCFLGCCCWRSDKKWKRLDSLCDSRPRKWKQFVYVKYIWTKITIRKFLFKSELAGSRKIAAYNNFTVKLSLKIWKVGSFTKIEISIFVDNSTRLFNGTLINKQRNKQENKLRKRHYGKYCFSWVPYGTMAEPNSIYMEHTMIVKDSRRVPKCSVGKLVYRKGRNAAVGKKQWRNGKWSVN